MKNYIAPGQSLDQLIAPSGGVVAGTAYLIGGAFVVSNTTTAAGNTFVGARVGIFSLPRATGASTAWVAGDKVYWDNTNKVVTKTSSGNTLIGVAAAAAGDSAATGQVLLDGAVR